MTKIRWPTYKDVLISIILNLISSAIFLILQSVWLIAEVQIPVFLGLLLVNDLFILMAISIFREKEEPVIKLSTDLKMCIEDFGKFFSHPFWAVMPNPFQEEPDFWKYYQDTFSYVLHSWYSSFKEGFEESRSDMDINELGRYSSEFCQIVKYYLMYAESFREFAKKYPIPEHIHDQYNRKFVGEFNTIFRPEIVKFLKNLQRQAGKERISIDIGSATPLETAESD